MNADDTPDGWLPDHIPEVEEWRPVVTHPDHYEVSSSGNVRTKSRFVTRTICSYWTKPKPLVTKMGGRVNNYVRVHLYNPERFAYVHHLVAEAFIGPRPEGCQVLHTDDCGTHNWLGNIRYGDDEENRMDRHVKKASQKLASAPF